MWTWGRPSLAFQHRVPIAVQHIHRPHLHAVGAGIAHQLGRGVEAHRLAVEQGGQEGIGVVALQPGADIDQQRKAGGMALGKPYSPKPSICLKMRSA